MLHSLALAGDGALESSTHIGRPPLGGSGGGSHGGRTAGCPEACGGPLGQWGTWMPLQHKPPRESGWGGGKFAGAGGAHVFRANF